MMFFALQTIPRGFPIQTSMPSPNKNIRHIIVYLVVIFSLDYSHDGAFLKIKRQLTQVKTCSDIQLTSYEVVKC